MGVPYFYPWLKEFFKTFYSYYDKKKNENCKDKKKVDCFKYIYENIDELKKNKQEDNTVNSKQIPDEDFYCQYLFFDANSIIYSFVNQLNDILKYYNCDILIKDGSEKTQFKNYIPIKLRDEQNKTFVPIKISLEMIDFNELLDKEDKKFEKELLDKEDKEDKKFEKKLLDKFVDNEGDKNFENFYTFDENKYILFSKTEEKIKKLFKYNESEFDNVYDKIDIVKLENLFICNIILYFIKHINDIKKKSKTLEKVFIVFDGTPSFSKITEQRVRRYTSYNNEKKKSRWC